MMNIPTLPTDNLYKFLAVFGLVLFVAGLVIPVVVIQAMNVALDEGNRAMETRLDDVLDARKADAPDAVVLDHKLNAHKIEIERQETLRVWWVSNVRSTITICVAMIYTGFFVSPLGFILWWWKVQRFQDRILQAEYATLVKELQAVPSGPSKS